MIDKNEYVAMFSQVTASDGLTRRVLTMKQEQKANITRRSLGRIVLAAALIALMALTVSASETVQNWFIGFFAGRTESALSQEQMEYIKENAVNIADSQTKNGWTVELRSAISDGTQAYIIIGVAAPENVNLEQTIVDGVAQDWFGPGNMSMHSDGMQDLVSSSEKGLVLQSYGVSVEEDGDGQNNTKNLVIQLNPNFDWHPDPFGTGVNWRIHIENIVHQYEDEEYRRELMQDKYAGQTDVMFTSEETMRLYRVDVLTEETWEFTVNFVEHKHGVELLSSSVTTTASVTQNTGSKIWEYETDQEKVELTSVILRPLSITAYYNCENGVNLTWAGSEHVYAVMRDGSRVALTDMGSGGVGCSILEAEAPIVLDEVEYILMADGTIITMPE